MSSSIKKIVLLLLFFTTIFIGSFCVWYAPVLFKGQAPYKIKDSLVIAKNFQQTGVFGFENKLNVFLAPSLVKDEAEVALAGNKLTTYLYAALFKVTGPLSPDVLVIVSILLNCLALLIFAVVVRRLYGFGAAALFSALYALTPILWQQIYSIGSYEFAFLFLSLFFLCFVFGRGARRENIWLFSAGICLVLAALAREAFLLLIPILFLYFWLYRSRRLLIPLFIPVVLILSVFYIPSFFSQEGGNVYSKLFFSNAQSENSFQDFSLYGHLYPDPYTYHFERQSFLDSYNAGIKNAGFIESLQLKKVLGNTGEGDVAFWERLPLGLPLAARHIGYFFSLEEAGGPFVMFLALIGLFYLRQKDDDLYKFFIFWGITTVLLLSFVVLASRPHLMDFSWAVPLLASLGTFYLIDIFKEKLGLSTKNNLIFSFFSIFIFAYSIFLADHVVFGNVYNGNAARMDSYLAQIKSRDINPDQVIAFGSDTQDAVLLNYLAEKSIVIFREATVKKLLAENKLKDAFADFKVGYIMAYDGELSKKITGSSGAINLTDGLSPAGELKISPLKSFILNLVR